MSFNKEQLRGAWKAGYEKGFQDGRDLLRREGWVKPRSPDEVREGATVKLLVETCFGQWKGLARVIYVDGRGGVHGLKLERLDRPDEPDSFCNTVDMAWGEYLLLQEAA